MNQNNYYAFLHDESAKRIGSCWRLYDDRIDVDLKLLIYKIAKLDYINSWQKLFIVKRASNSLDIFSIVEKCSDEMNESFLNNVNKFKTLK